LGGLIKCNDSNRNLHEGENSAGKAFHPVKYFFHI
jgi:hypothetical protein